MEGTSSSQILCCSCFLKDLGRALLALHNSSRYCCLPSTQSMQVTWNTQFLNLPWASGTHCECTPQQKRTFEHSFSMRSMEGGSQVPSKWALLFHSCWLSQTVFKMCYYLAYYCAAHVSLQYPQIIKVHVPKDLTHVSLHKMVMMV